jgi:hypothetical protein
LAATASAFRPAIRFAIRSTSASSSFSGTTRLTRPICIASPASISSPSSKTSLARLRPRTNGVIGNGGPQPWLISTSPNLALSAATVRSHTAASSHAWPRQ